MTSGGPPRRPDVGLIGLPFHQWSPRRMGVHQLMLRLADHFQVVYMDQPVGWRKALRPRPSPDLSEERARWPGFQLYQPDPWLPLFHRPAWLAELTFRGRLRRARAMLTARGCRRIVVYVFHPRYGGALDLLPHDVSCYHLEDDYSYSEVDVPTSPEESRLIDRVDQVVVHSPALFEKKCVAKEHALLVPNGVDYAAYATPRPEPADLADIPKPRIGYTGWVKRQLDFDLIGALAERRPEWSFVLVGAVQRHPEIMPRIEALRERDNVHFLGAKPTQELAAYPQHFDVCTMPYVVNDYTRYIYPLKLHEYLASGRPVVGSPIHTLEEFSRVVRLASTPDEWETALGAALADGEDEDARASRRSVARKFDWDALTARIAGAIEDRLDERSGRRGGSPARPGRPARHVGA